MQTNNKKGFLNIILIGVVALVLIILGAKAVNKIQSGDISLPSFDFPSLSFTPGDTNVNVVVNPESNNGDNDDDYYIQPDDDFDLGEYFSNNFPAYIANRSVNCMAVGGDWVCNDNQMGCYDIPSWDYTLCGSSEITALKLVCLNVEGIFTCNMHEISCEV